MNENMFDQIIMVKHIESPTPLLFYRIPVYFIDTVLAFLVDGFALSLDI